MGLGFAGSAVLLDIEGTTSSIRFVYDEMFPYVRRELESFLTAHFEDEKVVAACARIAQDAGAVHFSEWHAGQPRSGQLEKVRTEVLRLMDADLKATGLKDLQGLIWKKGFESGELLAHVYADVPPALKAWSDAGLDLRIYSSGSIAAQKLFFGHTEAGNLLPNFKDHYDTVTGPKKEAESYTRIAAEYGCAPQAILFLSDVVAELNAARTAGMQTGLSIRPENPPVEDTGGHRILKSFDEIQLG